MASRIKEQEKNEKIVRALTKLADNRKCINCGSLGPQYVCTNFSIFVCTTCSGIHREFTHRVKSISMATFTPAEVAALQAGGNQRARENYLREWDSSRQSLPETSNPDKLRDFIRAVYVDKRFSGDRRGLLSDGEDTFKQPDRSKYGQSPSYEDRNDDRRYTNRPGSRGSDRGFDDKTSPARFDDRDRSYQGDRDNRDRDRRYDERDRRFDDRDRRYDERDRNYDDRRYDDRRSDRRVDERDRRSDDRERKYDDRRFDERDRRFDERDRYEEQRRGDRSSEDFDKRFNRPPSYRGGETPPLRSVRDILGDDVPKLRVEDGGSRANGRADETESPHSTSSQGGDWRLRSSKSLDKLGNGTPKAAPAPAAATLTVPAAPLQPAISESLIDFSADPEPPKPAAAAAATTTTSPFDPFAEPPKANNTVPFDPFAATAEPPKQNVPVDPFAAPKPSPSTPFDPFAAPDQPGTVTSSTAGWASFDLSPPKATPPAAAPPPPTDFFQQPAPTQAKPSGGWNSSQPNGFQNFQPGQVLQQPVQTLQPGQILQQPVQTLQPIQIHPDQAQALQPEPWGSQQQQAAPAVNGLQSQRRAIPEDLFFSPHVVSYGMPMQMRFPQPQPPPPHFGMPGPMPGYIQQQPPARTKSNPFDLPGEPNQSFPGMAPLQSALPSFTPGPPPTQWQQPGMAPPPAGPPSFPPPSFPQSIQGGGFPPHQQMPGHMMQPPPQGHPGGFGSSQGFMNGSAPLPFPVQPAAGGNPFG